MRYGVILSSLIIFLIILIQAFLLGKVYRFEEKDFDRNVISAIKGLYDDLNLADKSVTRLNELISKLEEHVYLARVEKWLPEDSISFYTHKELLNFNIFTDCKLILFDADRKEIFYQKDIFSAASKSEQLRNLPASISNPPYHSVLLYFPNREKFILSNMIFWIVSSLVLLGVLIWLGTSLFSLNRQKSLNQLQRDFVNNFSHEFKTPLSVISLAAESLKKNALAEKQEKLLQYTGMVEYQANYLQGQIERLLRYSFSEKADLQLITEPVNIHELIREAVNNLQPLIEEKKAAIHFELNAANPVVNGDKNYLMIVLINLVENALKYSIDPVVTIKTNSSDQLFQIAVKDNGVGIEEKYLGEIFKKFFRIPKGDIHPSKGFGIGLSFVKKIIDSHRGKIQVKSIPGSGSEFIINLNPL